VIPGGLAVEVVTFGLKENGFRFGAQFPGRSARPEWPQRGHFYLFARLG
jgi:hypothetical protein